MTDSTNPINRCNRPECYIHEGEGCQLGHRVEHCPNATRAHEPPTVDASALRASPTLAGPGHLTPMQAEVKRRMRECGEPLGATPRDCHLAAVSLAFGLGPHDGPDVLAAAERAPAPYSVRQAMRQAMRDAGVAGWENGSGKTSADAIREIAAERDASRAALLRSLDFERKASGQEVGPIGARVGAWLDAHLDWVDAESARGLAVWQWLASATWFGEESPPAIGALLGIVRLAWGDPRASVTWVERQRRWKCEGPGPAFWGESEVEALLVALEAAPC